MAGGLSVGQMGSYALYTRNKATGFQRHPFWAQKKQRVLSESLREQGRRCRETIMKPAAWFLREMEIGYACEGCTTSGSNGRGVATLPPGEIAAQKRARPAGKGWPC
jgi:hypothetical protein